MLWLLKFCVFGHVHKWETVREETLQMCKGEKVVERGSRFTLRCEKCGDITKRDLI